MVDILNASSEVKNECYVGSLSVVILEEKEEWSRFFKVGDEMVYDDGVNVFLR